MLKRYSIFFIVFSIISNLVGRDITHRGLPFVKHYKKVDFEVAVQNWAIAQAPDGLMYFGNNDGLLEFDGRSWRIYSVPNHSSIRAIHIDSLGRIYVGAVDEFGYFERNQFGNLEYTSLSLDIEGVHIHSVWKIISQGDAKYFITGRKHIFKYKDGVVKQIHVDPIFTEFRGFLVKGQFYIFDHRKGLCIIENDTIYQYHSEMFDNPVAVYSILPLEENKLLIGSRAAGLFTVDLNDLVPKAVGHDNVVHDKMKIPIANHSIQNGTSIYYRFETILNSELVEKELYYGTTLLNGEIAYSTLKGGVYLMTQEGEFIDRYSLNEGLIDNSVFTLFEDMERNLWLTSEKGISVMEPQNGYRIFNTDNGIDGNILSLLSIDNSMYVGTTSGLYVVNNQSSFNVDKVHQVSTVTKEFIYVLSLTRILIPEYTGLLFSSLRNIHVYNKNKREVFTIHKQYGTYGIDYYPLDSSYLFLGHNEGIDILRKKKGKLEFEKVNQGIGFKENVLGMFFNKNGSLFVTSPYSGLYVVDFPELGKFDNPNIVLYDTENGLPRNDKNGWELINDTIIVRTSNGIYYPEKQSAIGTKDLQFKPVQNINNQLKGKELEVTKVKRNSDGNLWIGTSKGIVYYERNSGRIIKQPYYRISNSEVSTMCLDLNNRIWVACMENLYCFDSKAVGERTGEPGLHFREVVVGQDSILPIYKKTLPTNLALGEFDFNCNAIDVRVAYPSYSNSDNILFSYYLEGLDRKWSIWKKNDHFTISYLPVGKYTLYVKAINGIGIESNLIEMRFSINAPWYQSTAAYAVYILLAVLLVYLVVKINNIRLQHEKINLEYAVNAAVFTVEQQKEELLQQATQMELTNQELDKLSLVARQTDNAVVIMDAKGNYEWINEGFTRMYGYVFEELLHETSRNKIGRNSNLKISDLVSIWYGDKKPITYESLNCHREGYDLWVQTTLTPILDETGEVIRLIAIDANITKLKEAEMEIHKQHDEIQIQRDLALQQRDEIFQQKVEMTDSIRYAERIQKVVLSSQNDIEKLFPVSFVLNLPRDIVSGDFFWCHSEGGYHIVGVADCTGHGVPGAFMSLIGVSFLKEIVLTRGFFMPDQILNLLRDNVILSLQQTGKEGENKDGMDLSLITIDTKNKILYYSGANNPIYIINNKELTEHFPDKMPISIFRSVDRSFSLTSIPIKKNDRLYMFTDGFMDQFGGENEKKLKSGGFKKVLIEMQDQAFENQREYLYSFLKEWHSGIDQLDDILVVGLDLDSELNVK